MIFPCSGNSAGSSSRHTLTGFYKMSFTKKAYPVSRNLQKSATPCRNCSRKPLPGVSIFCLSICLTVSVAEMTETPFVVEWFVRNGVEVWSAVEGQQRFDNHVDKLLNYIRYWQASGESIKTSVRVKTRMEQLTRTAASPAALYHLATSSRSRDGSIRRIKRSMIL